MDRLGPGADYASVQLRLSDDSRFVWVEGTEPGQVYYISETHLFRWFVNLVVRIAKAGQARPTDQQLTSSMRSISHGERWSGIPTGAVAFAESLGLVAHSYRENEHVFPIAWMLSRAPTTIIEEAAHVLSAWADSDFRHTQVTMPLENSVLEGLSRFPDRVVEVLRLHGGLVKGERFTLQQIGERMALTRERVRQIESKFWGEIDLKWQWKRGNTSGFAWNARAETLRRPFLEGLLAELIKRRGSLLLKSDSPNDRLMQFCARCVGIPFVNVPHTEFLVLGAISEDFATLDSYEPPPGDAGRNHLAQALDAESLLGLSDADLKAVVDDVRLPEPKRLSQGQKVYLALKACGGPSHYSKVADAYNSMFAGEDYSQRKVRAILALGRYGVVWIGSRGTYALKEWGYKRPSMTLFDSVTEIVQQKFSETGKPVPFNIIVGEIGRYRQLVNPVSLSFASNFNPSLRRISKDSFVVGCQRNWTLLRPRKPKRLGVVEAPSEG